MNGHPVQLVFIKVSPVIQVIEPGHAYIWTKEHVMVHPEIISDIGAHVSLAFWEKIGIPVIGNRERTIVRYPPAMLCLYPLQGEKSTDKKVFVIIG